jgi:hypothetical protein
MKHAKIKGSEPDDIIKLPHIETDLNFLLNAIFICHCSYQIFEMSLFSRVFWCETQIYMLFSLCFLLDQTPYLKLRTHFY